GSRAPHQASFRVLPPTGFNPFRTVPAGTVKNPTSKFETRLGRVYWRSPRGRYSQSVFLWLGSAAISSPPKTPTCTTALLSARGALRRVLTRSLRFATGYGFRSRPFPVGATWSSTARRRTHGNGGKPSQA